MPRRRYTPQQAADALDAMMRQPDAPQDDDVPALQTPADEVKFFDRALTDARAKLARALKATSPGTAREASDTARLIATLEKLKKSKQAELPPPEDDPAQLEHAIREYVRSLAPDDPLRLEGLPEGTRVVLP